ncbi:hypothetical protein [Mesobacillus boroniphilus]|uniref:Uncharacterized protein n=1 Tax=Mesobacillus boroniphilus JCM 21738 TaxID=1294265 RepID=W4RUX6_9BACI|nr:hypothetical protein [Mesobacillus boroniphilus]GAE48235.1 hypothetical protein JCM21738_5323 [Mesobacillus boroniphilus JCM 21738]
MGNIKRKIFSWLTAVILLVSYAIPFSGQASAETVMTVQQAIENNRGTATIEGYIVGHAKGTNHIIMKRHLETIIIF